MGILPLKKRVNRDKCSFATKKRMFGVFAIDEILRYRGTWFPGSRTLCHPVWGYNFPIQTNPKNFLFVLWVILRGSPRFLAISGLCHFAIITTLNFGPWTTKLGETVGAIKKMTHNDNGHGPGRN